jgi:hypothetical protein
MPDLSPRWVIGMFHQPRQLPLVADECYFKIQNVHFETLYDMMPPEIRCIMYHFETISIRRVMSDVPPTDILVSMQS